MGNTPSKKSVKRSSRYTNTNLKPQQLPSNFSPLGEADEVKLRESDLSPITTVENTIEPILKPFENNETGRRDSNISTDAQTTALSSSVNSTGLPPNVGAIQTDAFDLDVIIQQLIEIGKGNKVSKSVPIRPSYISKICQMARETLLMQPTLIEISAPVKVVGDVHGQFTDLIRLFNLCGFPPSSNFLFLGDYVDRGKQSLETIILLLCYKVKYPENFFLLRGNHECANVTRVYGFYDECKRRANVKIWKNFVDVFDTLPIAAVIASKIFCVHGGISPSLDNMQDIRNIERPTDVPDYGLLNDLLWSDPSETTLEWEDNERGVSYCFGKNIVDKFLATHKFDLICRAHMVVEDGYEFFNGRTLVTVFSAPNYCGEFDNYGAIMSVNEDLLCSFQLLKPQENNSNILQKRRNSNPLSTA